MPMALKIGMIGSDDSKNRAAAGAIGSVCCTGRKSDHICNGKDLDGWSDGSKDRGRGKGHGMQQSERGKKSWVRHSGEPISYILQPLEGSGSVERVDGFNLGSLRIGGQVGCGLAGE